MAGTDFQALNAELEKSRKEIVELQERVKQLTARRRERENMSKKGRESAGSKAPDA